MQTKLTITQKKEWASMLYLKENLTQQEIADKVEVSRRTIINWIKAEKWEERKVAITITREEQIAHFYRQVGAINLNISSREEGKRFATSAEADTLNKLASTIKKMEGDVGIADIISVGMRFLNWLRKVDMEKAKDIARLYDVFIRENL